MRPPSYYNSIVKSNSSHYPAADFATSTSVRTSSSQLRSSLSSPSSSSYVSRSHLPFVPQSTLVAHCFTGVASSTRPYSSTGSSSYSPASRSSRSSYNSSGASSSTSLAWRPPSTKRNHLSGSSNSSSTYSPSSSLSSCSTNYVGSTSGSSRAPTYARPSYLSSSSSASSYVPPRPSYRPISSSNYYKPIRLRERPLLTQISSQIGGRDERPSHSNRVGDSNEVKSSSDPNKVDKEDEQPDESWSSDVTRNISRNKYLIKFREIDKQTKPSLADVDVAATIELPSEPEADRRGRESTVPDREPFSQTAATRAPTPSEPSAEMKIRPDSVPGRDAREYRCDEAEDLSKSATSEESPIIEKRKKRVARVLPADSDAGAKLSGEIEPKTTIKKERRDIKLKLKPVVTSKPSYESKAEQLTPKITPAKAPLSVEAPETKTPASTLNSAKKAPIKDVEAKTFKTPEPLILPEGLKEKPLKAKKLVKSSKTSSKTATPTLESKTSVCVEDERPEVDDETLPKPATIKKTAAKKTTDQSGEKKTKGEAKVRTKKSSDKTVAKEAKETEAKEVRDIGKNTANEASSVAVSPPVRGSAGRIRCRAYNYEDFNFLTVLGHGGWGFVILAELKGHQAYFAVKCIKKITIVEDDDYDSIMIERKVLALGNVHPFICKLFCTFETPGYLFFVMEYCAGGDLMFHVQREGKFTEARCRFYAAEIICAIRFLHNRHIIYRDLKLDNILLDARGHIRLVDFGMCQCRTYREEMLPSNFCGTPEYISPEIIKGVPYNHSVDWWSFGVLLYEMAVGKMPFRGNDENELLWNVCYEQIHYPMFLTKELTSLLKLLLEREPTMRMGMATCKAGDIHDQPFFRSVDWKAVEELRVPPPFVPEVRSNNDVQNFDRDFTESTCELSPVDQSTLDKIDQSQFEKFPYTNPEVQIFDSLTNLANTTPSYRL